MEMRVSAWSTNGAAGFPRTEAGFEAWLEAAALVNASHHLWLNNGTFFLHASVLHGGIRQQRIRESLGTADFEEACRRRDARLRKLASRDDLALSVGVRTARV